MPDGGSNCKCGRGPAGRGRYHGGMFWWLAIAALLVGFGQRVDGQLRMSSSPHLPLLICDHVATLKS